MADSLTNLAIGTEGSTSWKWSCLMLLPIQLVLARNQTEIAEAPAQTCVVFGAKPSSMSDFHSHIFINQINTQNYLSQSCVASTVVDWLGTQCDSKPSLKVEL
jgi:hypothetical protein